MFSGGSTTAKAVEALGLRPIGKADALRVLTLQVMWLPAKLSDNRKPDKHAISGVYAPDIA